MHASKMFTPSDAAPAHYGYHIVHLCLSTFTD